MTGQYLSNCHQAGVTALSLGERMDLAKEVMKNTARDSLRFRWLQDEATAEQWERASHAADAGAEVDAMMACR
jgi:dihydrodipicolinate synthase/N-acetylneuraminate lyase